MKVAESADLTSDVTSQFQLAFDQAALEWLRQHPSDKPLVIAYSDQRC